MVEIARNAPCACGSGRRYKHCHGRAIVQGGLPPGLEQAIDAHLQEHRADEIVRVRQQGHGRPIISAELGDLRIVCVGRRVFQGKGWAFFTDFLVQYMKDVLGRDWGTEMTRRGKAHPVISWLTRFHALMRTRAAGDTAVPEVGYMTAMFQLAYSLYLLEHHDQLPEPLIKRLRVPAQFRPALYETLVASAFALAGYRIEGAETAERVSAAELEPTPEFYVTTVSGKRYAVEAKCRERWRSFCDVADESFQAEVKSWVRRKLFEASAKRLTNPIYWLELSIPTALDEPRWRVIRGWIREAIDSAEAELGGRADPPAPAYVFLTNNPQLVDDEFPAPPLLAILESFLMEDFRTGRCIELEAGFAMRDRHREVTWVFECLSEVQRVPMTFDGTIPELREQDGQPASRLRIGSPIDVAGPDGSRLEGILVEIASMGAEAYVVVRTAFGQETVAAVQLTPGEQEAARVYGDAAFGKSQKKQAPVKDVFGWYDWFLEVYGSYDRGALLQQVSGHPELASYKGLSLADLRIRVARELAKAVHRRSATTPRDCDSG